MSRRSAPSAPQPSRPPSAAEVELDRLADPLAESTTKNTPEVRNKRELQVKAQVMPLLMQRIDISVASALGPEELRNQIAEIVEEIIVDLKIQLNATELRSIVRLLVDDMVGLGPLEPLLKDETVTDIMVNGPSKTYVERKGKVELTDVQFRDDAHVLHVATRIVTEVGRRVDESTPLVDARLKDGSRVNIIIPPLAIDGPTISIRKFSKKEITLDVMARQSNISMDMATVLKIAGRARLNILISGGTGSGKTTLLNAMSRMIDHGERTVTIEDAAELQLQQPHVVRLETRPANIEGEGEITMRHLVKNALRMRPDRIILGEYPRRGGDRHAAGDEHRPRRIDGHDPLQHPARRADAAGEHGRDVRLQAAGRGGARADPERHPSHHPDQPPCATASGGSPK